MKAVFRSSLALVALTLVLFASIAHGKAPPSEQLTLTSANSISYTGYTGLDPGGGLANVIFDDYNVSTETSTGTAYGVTIQTLDEGGATADVIHSGITVKVAGLNFTDYYACVTANQGASRSSWARGTMGQTTGRHHAGKTANIANLHLAWASGALQRT